MVYRDDLFLLNKIFSTVDKLTGLIVETKTLAVETKTRVDGIDKKMDELSSSVKHQSDYCKMTTIDQSKVIEKIKTKQRIVWGVLGSLFTGGGAILMKLFGG